MLGETVRGSSTTLRTQFVADEEDPQTVTGDVTITVVDATGSTVVDAATATGSGDGPFTYALPADAVATVGPLTITWAAIVDTVAVTKTERLEVVGGWYFDLADLRDDSRLEDRSDYQTRDLARARRWITSVIDGACGTSFVERSKVQTFEPCDVRRSSVWAGGWLFTSDPYPRSIQGLIIDGSALDDVSGYTASLDTGIVGAIATSDLLAARTSIELRYSAAYTLEPPPDLAEAALAGARTFLLSHIEDSVDHPATDQEFGGAAGGSSLPKWVRETIDAWANRTRIPAVGC